MSDRLIPVDAHRAASRAGIRTFAQSLSALIPTSVIVVALTGDWWLAVGLGAAGAIITAGLAGAAAYLSMLAGGIPEDYVQSQMKAEPRRAQEG